MPTPLGERSVIQAYGAGRRWTMISRLNSRSMSPLIICDGSILPNISSRHAEACTLQHGACSSSSVSAAPNVSQWLASSRVGKYPRPMPPRRRGRNPLMTSTKRGASTGCTPDRQAISRFAADLAVTWLVTPRLPVSTRLAVRKVRIRWASASGWRSVSRDNSSRISAIRAIRQHSRQLLGV